MADLQFHNDTLSWGERSTPAHDVLGFAERFSGWTGRAWLEVRGPGWRIPIDGDYGERRALLRQCFPDRPFASDWMDGRFPSAPPWVPPTVALAAVVAVFFCVAVVLALAVGWWAGLLLMVLAVWPLGRLRDGWHVAKGGLRAGPPWAMQVPWFDVTEVRVHRGARRSWVFVRGEGPGAAAWVPTPLLPALRARLRRLGGLQMLEAEVELDDAYLRWRAPAIGLPWGVGAGALLIAFFTPMPWTVLVLGAAAMACTALLAAMVSLRARGWGVGSVLAGTVLYGVALLVFGLVMGGWLGGS